MFRITEDPSSGSFLQCLAKKTCCHNTDYVHINAHDRTITVILVRHCIELPDDGSLVIRNMLEQILTFCWPCISVYLSQYLTNLIHKICFTISFISYLYMFRAHVLIIRRSKLHYTASGIVTPIGVMCNAILTSWWWAHMLETCRGMK